MSENRTLEQPIYLGYVSDPNGRGTTSLVLSCLLTLVLCVWQALHLNVPGKGQSNMQCVFQNMRWIIAGVYAPELVVFTAWRQWSSARILGAIVAGMNRGAGGSAGCMKNLESDTPEDVIPARNHEDRLHKWTKTHDFFACTGGFAVDPLSFSGKHLFLPLDTPKRLVFTARGVAFLAKCGLLPDIPEEDILDKSKANALAKALVIMQALWMLLQVCGRLVASLPVTLLEVNTVAHILCTMGMYAMWWHKPLLAKEPILISSPWIEELCAFMYMSSEMSGELDISRRQSGTAVKTLLASFNLYSKTPEIERLSYRQWEVSMSHVNDQTAERTREKPAFSRMGTTCKHVLQDKHGEKASDTAFFERRPRIRATTDLSAYQISEITSERWRLAANAIRKFPFIIEECILTTHDGCMHFIPQQLLQPRIQNWPQDDLLRNIGGLMVGMILWLSNLAYGGLHAAAWNEHFPSGAEKWLWRTSAVYISFCGGLWIVLNFVARSYGPLNDFWEKWMDGKTHAAYNVVLGTLVVFCGGTLCFARCFIVLEAFVSIRELPAAAYNTPNWTQLFPHF